MNWKLTLCLMLTGKGVTPLNPKHNRQVQEMNVWIIGLVKIKRPVVL